MNIIKISTDQIEYQTVVMDLTKINFPNGYSFRPNNYNLIDVEMNGGLYTFDIETDTIDGVSYSTNTDFVFNLYK